MERIQIDLIDMRHCPDRDHHYIGHFVDHMTKFNILFPLKDKSADEVARMTVERVLAYVEPPHIFHSDNDREFLSQLLHSLLETWSSGNVTFVNGRPRHSQSQGAVERGNRTIQEKIAAIKHDKGFSGKSSFPWMSWLPRIIFSMNTQIHSTTKEVPNKLVFGQMPRCQVVPGAQQHIVMEEEIVEITHFSSSTKDDSVPATAVENKSSSVTSSSSELELSSVEPQKWVIQKETILNWIPSISPDPVSSASCSSDSSGLPSLPSSPSPAEVEFRQPSKFIPPPSVGSCSNTDLLHEDLSSTSRKRKELDSPEDRHENIRKKARDNTLISANKMANYYNKTKAAKSTDFQVGDEVAFYVPKIDSQRIPGELVSVTGDEKIKFYKVATSAGLLKNAFSGGDLTPFNGPVHVNKDK